MRIVLVSLIVCGCGSVSGNQPDASNVDAIGDASSDAPSARCDVTKPFGSPAPVVGVNTTAEEADGWLSADHLTIYFRRLITTNSDDVYFATRQQASGPFNDAQLVEGVNTSQNEIRPVLTADGLTLFMQVSGNGDYDIRVSTRASTAAAFSAPAPVAAINTPAYDTEPWISEDGLVIYFVSRRDGNDNIFKASRASTGSVFSAPVPVGELNTTAIDYAPTLSKDGLEIFFASTRQNVSGDIFHATRSTINDGFGTPRVVAELSDSASSEHPSWVSADRCQLMFTSDRVGGSGRVDIWIATRPQ